MKTDFSAVLFIEEIRANLGGNNSWNKEQKFCGYWRKLPWLVKTKAKTKGCDALSGIIDEWGKHVSDSQKTTAQI